MQVILSNYFVNFNIFSVHFINICSYLIYILIGRRWRKTYNSTSRKKKDTINTTNLITNNTNRNDVDTNNIKGTDKVETKVDEHNDESLYVSLLKYLNYVIT